MPWGVAAAVGGSLISGYMSNKAQKDAAKDASKAQLQANQMAIDEQKRQFDATQKLLAPYVTAGTGALTGQQNLIGLGGSGAQQDAIHALEMSPEFAAYQQQGENAILQNASATGGLRGGNTQAALAQFRPQLLAELINKQYGRLGDLTSLGQNSAAMTGNFGMRSSDNISRILMDSGASRAGVELARGRASADNWANVGNAIGMLGGMYGGGGF